MFEVVFGFVLVLLGFAAVHDWKTTFVSDWVVYALFCVGVVGLVVQGQVLEGLSVTAGLGVLALLFYYGGVFAQGDARLLVALGPVLPGLDLVSRGWYAGGFVLTLLLVGLVYTLAISGWYAWKSATYGKACEGFFERYVVVFWVFVFGGLVSSFFLSGMAWGLTWGGAWVLFGLFLHAKAVEKSCFIMLTRPSALLEGDWLVSLVKIGNRVLYPSAAGLSRADIALLRTYRRSVVIKQGIPFVPVFFITFVLMGCVALGGYEFEVLALVRGVLS
jgi:Flp pilus assembly protein protease CpaA